VWVDVEDLAETCLKALTFDASGHERFLVTQASYDTQEIGDIIRERLPQSHQRIPVGDPGKRIADTHYSCDSAKAQIILGVQLRPLEASIVPLAHQLYALEGR
jgi:nucleoside-diphosphate-sugar epimerase